MKKENIKSKESKLSWKELLQFYKKVKIPWVWVVITVLMSFAFKKVENLLVPYTSKIMTGAIEEHGFLFGFVAMTLLVTFVEEAQGSVVEFTRSRMTRNVRHKVWTKMISLPMSFFHKNEPQRLVSRVTQDTDGTNMYMTNITIA